MRRIPTAASRRRPATSSCSGFPPGPGMRVDTGVAEGDVVPPEFDSMFAKVIAPDATAPRRWRACAVRWRSARRDAGRRDQQGVPARTARPARGRPRRARQRLARRLVARGEQCHAATTTSRCWRQRSRSTTPSATWSARSFCTSATRGRPACAPRRGPHGRAALPRQTSTGSRSACRGPARYRLVVDGRAIDIAIERLNGFESWLPGAAARASRILSVTQGEVHQLVEVDGASHQISRDDGGVVRASPPAVVLAIRVQAGDAVAAGERAGGAGGDEDGAAGRGAVRRPRAPRPGHPQRPGRRRRAARDARADDAGAGRGGGRRGTCIRPVPRRAARRAGAACRAQALRRLTLGFDGSRRVRREADRRLADARARGGAEDGPRRAEDDLLDTGYADLRGLFRRPRGRRGGRW